MENSGTIRIIPPVLIRETLLKKYINSVIWKLCGQSSFGLVLVESKSAFTSDIYEKDKKFLKFRSQSFKYLPCCLQFPKLVNKKPLVKAFGKQKWLF